MTRFGWLALAVTGSCVFGVGTARAEPGYSLGGSCVPLTTIGAGCPAGTACRADDMPGTCRDGFGPLTVCIPDGAIICCTEDLDCPAEAGSPLRACISTGMGGYCPEPGREYCAGTSRLTVSQFVSCHRIGGGPLVPWAGGDCDGDLVPNGVEQAFGTDPCAAPPPKAVWVPGMNTCRPLPLGCAPGETCTAPGDRGGECLTADGDGATVCVPSEAALYCGDGAWVCPGGQIEVEDPDARHTFCSPPYCGDDHALTTAACVRSPITNEPVPPDQGDCDRDGVPNGVDDEVCEPGEPDEDAGTNTRDGGDARPDGAIPGEDAGAGEDAAVEPMDGGEAGTDAGASVAPTFGGGGGCACRAAPGDAGSAFGLVAALGVALSLRAGRRARRRR